MRVLILSCNTGEGHNSCGRAIQSSFLERGVPCDMEDAFRFISPATSRLVTTAFNGVYRHLPGLFRFGYRYAERHPAAFDELSGIYKLLASGTERLFRFLTEGGYDAIICTHVLSALMLTEVLRRHPGRLATYFVATDYTCSPSCGQSRLDLYFIPHESLSGEFVSCGVPAEKLSASGIPVRAQFDRSLDRAAAKERIGLRPEEKHLLIMCGSMGCGPIRRLVRLIARQLPENGRVSVICGTNHRLRRSLERTHAGDSRIHMYGYVQDVSPMMDSADLYLTKPGGISVTEAARKRLPMVFVNAVAGCETYNLEFYCRQGAAVTADTPEELAELSVRLLADDEALARMSAAFAPESERSAAEYICRAVLSGVREQEPA
ncbi:MAG: glycosyltransferase [Oscillibacter sp.]|nr:glycosyltransferase [Oscillibacter sp.]